MSLLYLTQGADYEKKKTRSSATADGPRDALCQSKSRAQLCEQVVYHRPKTNRSNGVRALRLTDV